MKRPQNRAAASLLRPGLFLLALFLFRLAFGLCSEFWADEERQIYLLGLKFYTTGQWPFFGPVANAEAQTPGALQAVLVGGPLYLWPAPEAPCLFLNLLSFGVLGLLAWYCTRRFPKVPRAVIWAWVMLAPWTLSYSTLIVNPSYALVGGILFTLGFLETCPPLGLKIFPPWLSNLLMGFSLFWTLQLHLSAMLLFPLYGLSLYFQFHERKWAALYGPLYALAGAAFPLALLIPTFVKYQMVFGIGDSQKVLALNPENLKSFFTILARLLSFSSFELLRFIGANSADRTAFFQRNPWLLPFGVLLLVAGYLQVLSLVVQWFRAKGARWVPFKWAILALFLLIYTSFLFTHRDPASHTYYIFLPVVMIYAFHCWEGWLSKERGKKMAAFFLAAVALYQAGLAFDNFKIHSLYKDRPRVVEAIEKKDYRLAGDFYQDHYWQLPLPQQP